ncbi:hypothetical protein [Clostridium sp.]|uniref:hypothetical protein n=1 Tax=Clostridium sp. TaxID=1506 RepID=UPI002622B07D|nr:hypothetical protein [Clostridium sp.]
MIKNVDKDTKKVIKNIINGIGIKGGSILVAFFTTPAYMRYFENNSILGIWFTILSVLSWILNFDLGIGNGIRNRLVITLSKNDLEGSKKYISSGYIFLSIIALFLAIFIFIISQFIPWNKFFNISIKEISPHVLKDSIIIVLFGILVQFVLRLISSILYALQESFIPNLLALITNIVLLIYVSISNYTGKDNNITSLAFAYFLSVNIPLLLATIIIFFVKLREIRPSIKYFDIDYALDTLKVGGAFLGLQLEAMIINNTSVFFITWLLGSALVVEYNLYFKIFSLTSTIYALITVPIWSAITKAKVENNYEWIKKTTRILQIIAIIFVIGEICVLPIMQWIFDIWLKENTLNVDYLIMIFFAIEQGIIIWSGIYASICSGLNEIKMQFILMSVGAIIMIPLVFILSKLINNYYSIIIAHCLALLPYCIGQTIWLENYLRKGDKYHK